MRLRPVFSLLIGALASGVKGDDDDLLTKGEVLLYAFLRSFRGDDSQYPKLVKPNLAGVKSERVPATKFEAELLEFVMQSDYLLTLTAPGREPWQVYSVKNLIGREAVFTCDNIVYSDWHRSNWGNEPHRSLLHWQAEWHKTATNDCYFVMSEASESPPSDGLEFFGRYPAGLQLMYLLKSGVIRSGRDPWLLYIDADLFFTRPGDVVADITAEIEKATTHANGTLEAVFTHQKPSKVPYDDFALLVATDVGCAFKRGSAWPRLNSGTLLFRPVPVTAYIFDATVQSWILKRKHRYDRLDQAMLTTVLTDAFDYPHDNVRRMCQSDPKPWISFGADEDLWRDACEGRQLVFTRSLDYSAASAVTETRSCFEKWLLGEDLGPKSVALACNRVLGGSMAGTPLWVSNDLWNWQCGDVGMHMIGGMGIHGAKFRAQIGRWRERHFAKCAQALPMKTMLDGSPLLPPNLAQDGKRLNSRLGSTHMRPFTTKEKVDHTSRR